MISGFFRIVIGVVFGVICAAALSPAVAAFNSTENNVAAISTLVIVVGMAAIAWFAPTIRRAFGRGFIILGCCCFALPLSAVLLAGKAGHEVVSNTAAADQGAAVVGAGLAGVAFTGAAGFIGFILGSIFIVVGLILALGGRREVIIVQR